MSEVKTYTVTFTCEVKVSPSALQRLDHDNELCDAFVDALNVLKQDSLFESTRYEIRFEGRDGPTYMDATLALRDSVNHKLEVVRRAGKVPPEDVEDLLDLFGADLVRHLDAEDLPKFDLALDALTAMHKDNHHV